MTAANVYQQRPTTGAKAESSLHHADLASLVGKAVGTVFAKSQLMIRHTAEDTWELLIRRSFSDYWWLWLQDAAAEYGLSVQA